MILPDIVLPSWKNLFLTEVGMDSSEQCLDKPHFNSYPYNISYQFNSRGFRDAEWPDTLHELKDAIWCFGDSFTVGLGSPLSHTWTNILQSATTRRCINISLNGASNDWIARRAAQVIETISPKDVVIHWSYLWRGEDTNSGLSDIDRMIHMKFVDGVDMTDNFSKLVTLLDNKSKQSNIVYSNIPEFAPLNLSSAEKKWNNLKGEDWPKCPRTKSEFNQLPRTILTELESFDVGDEFEGFVNLQELKCGKSNWIDEFSILDYARDGHHYDKLTAEYFVSEIMNHVQVATV